jgi:hypothetical protein
MLEQTFHLCQIRSRIYSPFKQVESCSLSFLKQHSATLSRNLGADCMKSARIAWNETSGWNFGTRDRTRTQLIIYFGSRTTLASPSRFHELRLAYPRAILLGCSTGGQIDGPDITDAGITALAIDFDDTQVSLATSPVTASSDCRAIGSDLARQLLEAGSNGHAPDSRPGSPAALGPLAGVFVLSDGLAVNGSQLVAGLLDTLGTSLPVMGGLAGDGGDFTQTLVGANAPPKPSIIAAVGFYGSKLHIGHGSAGGWDMFGPRRIITRSSTNTLFELDGQPALDLYERYLGEDEARGLPGTALLFPLLLRDPARSDHEVVRTVLAIDREAHSLTFAGDMPEGWTAQLMRGNFDRLSQGAAQAASAATSEALSAENGLSVMISCIGRRLLMGQRVHDELEAARAALPAGLQNIGFYSYGEISPHAASGFCELHNQTMTVMTLREVA